MSPASALLGLGLVALAALLPMAIQGWRRRGTGEHYEADFRVQRAPQIALGGNVLLLALGSESWGGGALDLLAWLPRPAAALVSWLGVALYASGLGFLVAGWYALGANFSLDAELLEGQTVTRRGPYRVVLHPGYSGVGQALIGAGLATGSVLSLAFTGLVVGPLGHRRARYEEELLRTRFGDEYERYARSVGWRRFVPRFVPLGF